MLQKTEDESLNLASMVLFYGSNNYKLKKIVEEFHNRMNVNSSLDRNLLRKNQ